MTTSWQAYEGKPTVSAIKEFFRAVVSPGRIPADVVEASLRQERKLQEIRAVLRGEPVEVREEADDAERRLKGNH